jgi:soluble lytic murein transglycosylase-like protein
MTNEQKTITNSRYKLLVNKITSYENRDIKLDNMQKTVMFCYGLTSYEARYYSIIFNDFSQKYNIPWEVYPALIKIESNFNSGIMSKQRAKGIAQVLESTGKIQADKLGIPFNEGTLWNCVLNMVIGFDYFSEGFTEKIESTTVEKALKHAIRRYCGGPGYAQINPDARIYVKEYKSTVWDEYLKVSYIYKGVKYDQLIAQQDSLKRVAETANSK